VNDTVEDARRTPGPPSRDPDVDLRRPGAWESEADADDSPGATPPVLRPFGAITVRVLWVVQDLNPTPHESAVLSRDRAGGTNRAMSE
jgi:hypothetical protein